MADMSAITRQPPPARVTTLQKFANRITNTTAAANTLKKFGKELSLPLC